MKLSNDIFLLMTSLSSIKNNELLINLFLDGMVNLFPEVKLNYHKEEYNDEINNIVLGTENKYYGYFSIDENRNISAIKKSLLRNSIQMLSIFIQKNEIEDELKGEKEKLLLIADSRRKSLYESNLATLNIINDLKSEIIKRKEIEHKIKLSELKFKNIFEFSSSGIVIARKDGKVLEWNKSMEKITHIKQQEVIGKPIWDIQYKCLTEEMKKFSSPEKIRQLYENAFNNAKMNTESGSNLRLIINASGNEIWIREVLSKINVDDEEIILVFMDDITENVNNQKLLNELNRKLESKINLRVRELEETVKELNELNDIFIDTEERNIKLKNENIELRKKIGQLEKKGLFSE